MGILSVVKAAKMAKKLKGATKKKEAAPVEYKKSMKTKKVKGEVKGARGATKNKPAAKKKEEPKKKKEEFKPKKLKKMKTYTKVGAAASANASTKKRPK